MTTEIQAESRGRSVVGGSRRRATTAGFCPPRERSSPTIPAHRSRRWRPEPVGIGALYRRYGSKEALLATLCGEGLSAYVADLEAAVGDDGEPWPVFVDFMQRVVDAAQGR